jgi:acyl transferase domain-containing protein
MPFTARRWTRFATDLVQSLSGLEMRAAALPMYSSVTGDRVGPNCDRRRLLVAQRARAGELRGRDPRDDRPGVNTFVEIGPRAVLAPT